MFGTKAMSVIDALIDFNFLQETRAGTPTLCDPNDISDYEGGNDVECVQADDEDISSKSLKVMIKKILVSSLEKARMMTMTMTMMVFGMTIVMMN